MAERSRPDAREEVAFELPRRLRLARISFHNGYTGSKARDYPSGRAARVVLTMSPQGRPPTSTVVARHPTEANSDLTTIDCDFGGDARRTARGSDITAGRALRRTQ